MAAGNPEARIVSSAPVSTGSVVWRARGQLYVTVVVKATFGLVNDQAMELVEPAELVRGELYHRDNPSRSVRATSDMAPYLSRADVTLIGHAFAPSGEPATMVPVRLAVFREHALLDKTAHVYGDRRGGAPAPFEKIPLMYEKALGGVGWDDNPMGIGMQAGGAPDPTAPNIVHPTEPTKGIGFGPISRTWPARRRLLGKTDRKALDKPVAVLPDGFEWAYFQAAPLDQQIDFLHGDEWVVLEGIHPGVPRISSRLPSARITGIVVGLGDRGQVRGLDFHADVLRIDADEQSCSVVWRSSMPVQDEASIDAIEVSVGLEIAGQTIEWSEASIDGGDDIDAHETMDLDESALIEDGASIDDESDFAKTVPREDKVVPATAPRPLATAPRVAALPLPSPPPSRESAPARLATPLPLPLPLPLPPPSREGAPRPEKTSLWTPEMAAALRERPAELLLETIDDPPIEGDTQKLAAKKDSASLSEEGTLKLKPLQGSVAEEGTMKLSPLRLPVPSARAPLATIPLIDLMPAPPKPKPKKFDGTFALSLDDQENAADKAAVPFAGAPRSGPLSAKGAPRSGSRFEGTMALSAEDADAAAKKAETPFGQAAPPHAKPVSARAIPGAPWSPKSGKAPPPRPPKPRLDQTVSAIHDAPTGGHDRAQVEARAAATTLPAPALATTLPAPVAPATTLPAPAGSLPPSMPFARPSGAERGEPARVDAPPHAGSTEATPFGSPSIFGPSALPSFTDVPVTLPPPVAPPPRGKLPPLRPTLPRGAPAPRVTATREAAALRSLDAAARRAQDTVPVVNATAFAAFSFPWQLKAATDSLVVVVKATCDLQPDGPARLRSQADPASGDLHDGGDAARTLAYASDFAVFKPRADVTLVGHAYAPGGSSQAAQAQLRFGSKKTGFERRIAVFGERRWKKAGIKLVPEAPKPFKKVPLTWERAFGGPTFEKNPSGVGIAGDLLPQLEDPTSLVTSPNDTPEPACFAGMPPRWGLRRAFLGTFDAAWKKSRWPYFPDDFDWSFFQAAPAAQQLEHLAGDETFELVGVHADHPVIRGRLPGVRPRCFAQKTGDLGGDLHEVLLRLDTVAFEPDRMMVTLVWRGVIDVVDETAEDVAELFVLEEKLAGPAIDRAEALSKYTAAKLPPAPAEVAPGSGAGASSPANDATPGEAAEPAEIAPLSAEESAALRAEVAALLASNAPLDGKDFAGADLSDIDFSGRSLRDVGLARAKLSRCKLAGANLSGAQLEGALLDSADLTGADLTGADLTRADLSAAVLEGAKIGAAIFANARADGARFTDARGDGASFAGASLKKARFDRAVLGSADFTRAELDFAVLDAAELADVRLYDAKGTGVSFNGAKLEGARADGVTLRRSSLQRVQARSSIWDNAILDESTFLGAVLAESGFARASCRAVIFSGADLTSSRLRRGSFRGASFLKSNLMTATLEGADLEGADLRGANLHGAETNRAKLAGAKLDLAIVTQTKLAEGAGTS